MNIYDVSQKAGVSIATVSRVINGNDNVSEKTRQKVLSVMEEVGYTPNVFARGLNLNTMQTIGIMCSDSSDTYLANAVYFLERELRSHGYDSFLCCSGYEQETKENYFELLLSKRVDAIILVGSSMLDLREEKNNYIVSGAKKVPVMLMNGFLDRPGIYSVLCDDRQAVFEAASSFIKNGRKRILFLYRAHTYSGNEKLAGYKKALQKAGLPVDDTLIRQCPKTKHLYKVEAFLERLCADGVTFDAVIASEDFWAVGAVKYAKSHNLRIPEDISIIGYNNSVLAQCCEPELTTLDNKVETLSMTTVNTLMQVLNGKNVPKKTMITAELISRNTTDF